VAQRFQGCDKGIRNDGPQHLRGKNALSSRPESER
jgi:hypothetical protein